MKSLRSAIVFSSAVALSGLGLAPAFAITGSQGGTLIGGIAGGVVGSQFGSGSGKTAATIGGVLVGAWLGSQIGGSMSKSDSRYASNAASNAAHKAAVTGKTHHWRARGASGKAVPHSTYRTKSGRLCRKVTMTTYYQGDSHKTTKTACKNSRGYWYFR